MSQADNKYFNEEIDDMRNEVKKLQEQIDENKVFREKSEWINDLPARIDKIKQLYDENKHEVETMQRHTAMVDEKVATLEKLQQQAEKLQDIVAKHASGEFDIQTLLNEI